jgi:hypothetical protein
VVVVVVVLLLGRLADELVEVSLLLVVLDGAELVVAVVLDGIELVVVVVVLEVVVSLELLLMSDERFAQPAVARAAAATASSAKRWDSFFIKVSC